MIGSCAAWCKRLVLVLVVILPVLWGPAPARAENAADQYDLSGYWREGGKLLKLEQSGVSVRGNFATEGGSNNHSRCTKSGDLYFKGTLGYEIGGQVNEQGQRRAEFKGDMLVCNPQLCVDANKMHDVRWTGFEFFVSDDCQSLSGKWLWNEVHFKHEDGEVQWCRDSGKTEWRQDFSATRLISCESVERAKQSIEGKRAALAAYQKYRDYFADGTYRVDDQGRVVDSSGRVIAQNFEALQDLVLRDVVSATGSARVAGGIEHFDIDQAVQGVTPEGKSGPCWCETVCEGYNKCADPWLLEECQGHEAKHCQELTAVCRQVRMAHSPSGAADIWNRWANDYMGHLDEEIAHYTWGIEFLENKITNAGNCY